jgi:hypothetical protein
MLLLATNRTTIDVVRLPSDTALILPSSPWSCAGSWLSKTTTMIARAPLSAARKIIWWSVVVVSAPQSTMTTVRGSASPSRATGAVCHLLPATMRCTETSRPSGCPREPSRACTAFASPPA